MIATYILAILATIAVAAAAILAILANWPKKTYTIVTRMKCKVTMGNMFGELYKTDAYVILRKCDQNGKYSAYITTGTTKQNYDVDAAIFEARKLGYTI